MSLWEKIVEKKGLVIAAAAAVVAIGGAMYLSIYSDSTRAIKIKTVNQLMKKMMNLI